MKNGSTHLFRSFGSEASSGSVPEWIHLLPAGTFSAWDGRGPFYLKDAGKVISASMAKGPLPIDQDHATDMVSQTGMPAPARGWIVEMQARDDGIWGRVEWTETGKALLADRAYRGISPVIIFDKGSTVLAIRRAALTNDPALDQLTTVFSGDYQMNWKEELAALVGLGADASDEDVLAAVKKSMVKPEEVETMAAQKVDAEKRIASLTETVNGLKTELATLSANSHLKAAEQAVDAAIAAGKPIKPQRATWVELFAADPDKAQAALDNLPSINGEPIEGDDGEKKAKLSAEEAQAVKLTGITEEDYLAARQDEKE